MKLQTLTIVVFFSIAVGLNTYGVTFTSLTDGDWNNLNTWSTSGCGGSPAVAKPLDDDNVIICAGDSVYLSENIEVHDLTINNSGSLDVTIANYNIDVLGNWVNNGNVSTPGFQSRSATVAFKGVSLQQINGATKLNNLLIDNTSGVNVVQGRQDIVGTLTLTNGLFNTNDSVVLCSDGNGTARIAEIIGGSIAGEITVERFVVQGINNWRFFSSPVGGATLADWQDDFATSGFPGSDAPNFGWTSLYSYDETLSGASSNGYLAPTHVSDPINVGEGYMIYLGPLPLTFEVKGPANTGTFSLPVTYTDDVSQPDSEDGWNLVGNPYPSAIDWDSPSWIKTNIGSTIYILKEDGSYASYPGEGPGTNGGTKDIASSQGFWVQATGINPVLTATEGVKSTVDVNFLKSSGPASFIKLAVGNNGFKDEAIVRFHPGAADTLDKFDGAKLTNTNSNMPNLSTVVDNMDLVINSMADSTQEFSLPVRALFSSTGTYTLEITTSNLTVPQNSIFVLQDLLTGTITDLMIDSAYTFTISNLSNNPRFTLLLQKGFTHLVADVSCSGESDGSITISPLGNGPWDYACLRSSGDTLYAAKNATTIGTVQGLTAGTYTMHISDHSGYFAHVFDDFTIAEPLALSAQPVANLPSCYGNDNGNIQMNLSGGVGGYTYNWSSGENTSGIANLISGSYAVSISDQNNCELMLIIELAQPAELIAESQETNVSCNGEADGSIELIIAGGTIPYSYNWSNGENTKNVNALSPGTYSVMVTDVNGCESFAERTITEPQKIVASFEIASNVIMLADSNIVTIENNSSGAISYLWDFADGSYSTEETPFHLYSDAGYYQVYLTAYNGLCESQANAPIQVIDNPVGVEHPPGIIGPVKVSQNEDGVSVTFSFENPMAVTVSICTVSGQLIMSKDKLTAHDETVNYDLHERGAGIYLVNIAYSNVLRVTKLAVVGK